MEDYNSPFVSIESVILSYSIDSSEEIDASILISGEFPHAHIEEKVLANREGTMPGILVLLDPVMLKMFGLT
jgi:hypothetical protein